jgi:RNA polymerase sigma-B factor
MTTSGSGPDVDHLWREYGESRKRSARNALVNAHSGLAVRIASDYSGRGVENDDLQQIALLGLVKAVERYDPERGVPFSPFASRTINGELKRYFRDHTWSVRPPRSAQELHLQLRRSTDELSQRLGRSPTVPELARELDASEEDVLEAMEAGTAYTAASIDAPLGGAAGDERTSLADRLTSGDQRYHRAEVRMVVEQLLDRLPEREAEILQLRFYDELSQAEIAERIGISQMHVSRLLRRTLRDLRTLLDAPTARPDEVP